MAGIEADPQRIADYARTVAESAGALRGQRHRLGTGHLSAAFGEIGRRTNAGHAYAAASAALSGQLAAAAAALGSVADQLDRVAEAHASTDADSARGLRRAAEPKP